MAPLSRRRNMNSSRSATKSAPQVPQARSSAASAFDHGGFRGDVQPRHGHGMPLSSTTWAASGSTQMLNSAVVLTLPPTAPPPKPDYA